MKLGYLIIYVPSVAQTLAFYATAFNFKTRFVHESGDYGELETGGTVLAFASEGLADLNGLSVRPNRPDQKAAGFEIALVTEHVEAALAKLIDSGGQLVAPAQVKPWGQTVGYGRDLNGTLIELCTAIA